MSDESRDYWEGRAREHNREIDRLRAELAACRAAREAAPRPDREALGRIAWEQWPGRKPGYTWAYIDEPIREHWRRVADAVAAAVAPPAQEGNADG